MDTMYAFLRLGSATALAILCTFSTTIVNGQANSRSVNAFIVDTPTGAPEAIVDLGILAVGNGLQLEVVLRNLTEGTVSYDSVATGCSCQKIFPQRGDILPGDVLKVSLTLDLAVKPSSIQSGGSLSFKKGSLSAMEMSLKYRFDKYAGFPTSVIMVDWNRAREIAFRLPVIIGDEVAG